MIFAGALAELPCHDKRLKSASFNQLRFVVYKEPKTSLTPTHFFLSRALIRSSCSLQLDILQAY